MPITVKQLDAIDAKIVAADALSQTIATQSAYLKESKKQLEELEAELRAFAEEHIEEIGEQIILRHGVIGFKNPTRPALLPLKGFTWARVLERLRALGLTDYIRTTEEVNKEKLKSEAPEPDELKKIGLGYDDAPKFFYGVFKV
jgi:phage host-nuclease inhibitor protein Gam